MNWRLLLTGLLAAAALAVGWSLWKPKPDANAPVVGGRADYLLRDFELVSLDAQGREAFTLRAPRLARDPAVRTLDVATPVFTVPPRAGRQGEPWVIRAQRGWVSAEGDEIRLNGNVDATTRNAQGAQLRMQTQRLNVFPEREIATSDAQVTLKQPGFILTGQPMHARLDTGRVQLKDIKARHE